MTNHINGINGPSGSALAFFFEKLCWYARTNFSVLESLVSTLALNPFPAVASNSFNCCIKICLIFIVENMWMNVDGLFTISIRIKSFVIFLGLKWRCWWRMLATKSLVSDELSPIFDLATLVFPGVSDDLVDSILFSNVKGSYTSTFLHFLQKPNRNFNFFIFYWFQVSNITFGMFNDWIHSYSWFHLTRRLRHFHYII